MPTPTQPIPYKTAIEMADAICDAIFGPSPYGGVTLLNHASEYCTGKALALFGTPEDTPMIDVTDVPKGDEMVKHEQIANSGRIQFFVWDAVTKMFRRDFDGEMWFTRDGYNRLWEARHA